MKKASIKNLISAMAALYILNIYYSDDIFPLSNNSDKNFLSNWSALFDINVHSWYGGGKTGYIKKCDFDDSIYFIKLTDDFQKKYDSWNIEYNNIINSKILQHKKIIEYINSNFVENGVHKKEEIDSYILNRDYLKLHDIGKDYISICMQSHREASKKIGFDMATIKFAFEAVLNKNQPL